jgi:tetratricopeptide (TPR) repeat protein
MNNHPSHPETAAATVLLGRTLLAQDKFDACRRTMEQDLLRLSDSPEIIDLYLLLGQAEMKLRRPQDVLDHMEILGRAQSFRDLSHRQFLDFSFLYGYGSLGQGQHEAAVEFLELFLVRGEDDPRQGEVFVMLGQANLAEGQVIQARSAALEARKHMGAMDEYWRTESRKLYAQTALAMGDKEAAFRDLESEVRTTLDEDLILFLAKEFIKERRYQRAITTAELLSERDTPKGDQARYDKVIAMWKQAEQTNVFDDFPAKAIAVAHRILDEDLQKKVAHLIGEAYEQIGDLQKASEAFRGILR